MHRTTYKLHAIVPGGKPADSITRRDAAGSRGEILGLPLGIVKGRNTEGTEGDRGDRGVRYLHVDVFVEFKGYFISCLCALLHTLDRDARSTQLDLRLLKITGIDREIDYILLLVLVAAALRPENYPTRISTRRQKPRATNPNRGQRGIATASEGGMRGVPSGWRIVDICSQLMGMDVCVTSVLTCNREV